MQHEQREQPAPAQLADEGVLRSAAPRAGRARRLQRRDVGDGLFGGLRLVRVMGRVVFGARRWRRDFVTRATDPCPQWGGMGAGSAGSVPCGDGYTVAVAGSSMRRGSSVSRAITRRWICDVPS